MKEVFLLAKPVVTCMFIAAMVTGFRSQAKACTAFCIKDSNNLLVAKNLDWPVGDGLIFLNKRGLFKEAYIKDSKRISWISKYGSITFNQFGKEFPLGGMNEKGLVIEELNSWGETPATTTGYRLNEMQWVQYCLDNFATVREINETKDSILTEPLFINLHYIITDGEGNTLIVEFYQGKSHFISGDEAELPVLSNNHYKQSIDYIKNFKGFGGNLAVKSNTSGERFVRAATMIRNKPCNGNLPDYAFSILEAVKQEDTQWSIVYDIHNLSITFKTANYPTRRTIELSKFDFSCSSPVVCASVDQEAFRHASVDFHIFNERDNELLLSEVYRKYELNFSGDKDRAVFDGLMEYGNMISCR